MKFIYCVFALFIFSKSTFGITPTTKELSSLCKVWGFLKYHHPQVASGKFDWDKELLNQLESKEANNFNERMIHWIHGLGNIPITHVVNKAEFNTALDWIKTDELIDDSLEKLLWIVYNNRMQGKQYYVKSFIINGTILFNNENEYPQMDYANEKMRLLGVFRYWNAINYFYPYVSITDTNWNSILLLAIDKMKLSTTRATYIQTLRWLAHQTCDGHNMVSMFYTISRDSLKWTLATYQIFQNRLFVNGFNTPLLAKTIPLQIGDEIMAIDGKSVKTMIDYWKPFISGSNEAGRNANISYFALSGLTDSVIILAKRKDSVFSFTAKRYGEKVLQELQRNEASSNSSIIDGIPYLSFEYASNKEIESFLKKNLYSPSIIFDLRNYPKGDPKIVLQKMLSNERIKFADIRLMDTDNPGLTRKMNKDGTQLDYSWIGQKNKDPYKGKVVVLVDGFSVSHAEFTAMALQTMPQVTIIGSQTAGADGNVTSLVLPGNIKTNLSSLGIWYPNGDQCQRKGIKLDIEVLPTLDGVKNGKDEILERAIVYLKTGN